MIRRHFDHKNRLWQFAIVDVIDEMTESTDGRNYWKVLKNRLKKSTPQLVTRCNQLKMLAKDGKFYATDTADAEVMLELLLTIPKAKTDAWKMFVEALDEGRIEDQIGTPHESKLKVDAYETERNIFIEAMTAGAALENISIEVKRNKVIIEGKRVRVNDENLGEVINQELLFTTFSRIISLPSQINIKNVEKVYALGRLKIKLEKI